MIAWFRKRAGELATDGEATLIIGEPNVIRLPAELGGEVREVLSTGTTICPHCGERVKDYQVRGGIGVAECDQFYWYRSRRYP